MANQKGIVAEAVVMATSGLQLFCAKMVAVKDFFWASSYLVLFDCAVILSFVPPQLVSQVTTWIMRPLFWLPMISHLLDERTYSL